MNRPFLKVGKIENQYHINKRKTELRSYPDAVRFLDKTLTKKLVKEIFNVLIRGWLVICGGLCFRILLVIAFRI